MISASFQLTTAQVEMLIAIAYHNWSGDCVLPEYKRTIPQNDFVSVAQRLIAKGLVTHHEDAPPYRATSAGYAMADMIVDNCQRYVQIRNGKAERDKQWSQKIKDENRYRASVRARLKGGTP